MESVPIWLIWMAAGGALVAADLLLAGANLVLLGTALAAATSALASALGVSLETQIWIFLGAAIAYTPAILRLRPRGKRAIRERESGWAEGLEAITEDWDGRIGVRLRGDFFPAKGLDGRKPPADRRVRVSRLDGITAIVDILSPDPASETDSTDVQQKGAEQ